MPIRASKLKLFQHCDAWLDVPDDTPQGYAAQRGTDIHAVLASFLRHDNEPSCAAEVSIQDFCNAHDYRHIFVESRMSLMPMGDINFDDEAPSNALFTGQPDLVLVGDAMIVVVDWKTGRLPVSPINNAQLLGYAGLLQKALWISDRTFRLVIGTITELSDPIKFASCDYTTEQVKTTFDQTIELVKMSPLSRHFAGEHCDDLYCHNRKGCQKYANLY